MKGSLFILTHINGKKEIPLDVGRYTLGRSPEASLQIASEQISRIHAEIIVSQNDVRILDHGSANGTAVNGKFISSALLKHRDQILLGDVLIEYHNEDDARPTQVQNAFRAPSEEPKSKLFLAATKVITDKFRPRALFPLFVLLFAFVFLFFSLFTSLSYTSLVESRILELSLSRGQTLARAMAEKNKTELSQKQELLIDIDSFLEEKGVVEALIIDDQAKILSPISKRNQFDLDPKVKEALSGVLSPPEQNESNTYSLVYPIRLLDTSKGRYTIIGVAKIIYAPTELDELKNPSKALLIFLLLCSLGLALGLGWIASKSLSSPILKLADRINHHRQGKPWTQNESVPFKEWEPLFEAIDTTIKPNKP